MTVQQATKIRCAILSRRSAFAYSVAELPGYHGPEGPIHIQLDHRRPIFTSKRKQSDAEKAIQNEKCQELLDNDIIEQAPSSNYASPPVIVAKKDADGQLTDSRFCIDYRRINDATTADLYPMPLPEEIFRECRGARVFSKLDLRAGYHQIPLTEGCRNVTAFWWNNNLWRYKRLPFGLKNAPAEFQKRVDLHLGQAGLLHCCRAFMDDLIIFSPDGDSHAEHVSAVLDCLQAPGLRVHPQKSCFCAPGVEYLGHFISAQGLSPTAAKVAAIRAVPPPRNVRELRSRLGHFNYYRCYLPGFSTLAKPLTEPTRKDTPWVWCT